MALPTYAPHRRRRTPAPAASVPRPGRRRDRLVAGLLHLLLGGGLLLMIGPFVWMLVSSFKPEAEVRRVPPTWWPEAATLANYRELFSRLDFPQYFANSALVAVGVTVGNVLICAATGYALAKLPFRGRGGLFAAVVGTVMVPPVVWFIPVFVLVSNLGMVNTYAGLVLPNIAQAINVFLMRQFMLSIPDDLLEAARIDGASEWRVFWRIVLPLSGAPMATVGILTFLGSWNNFLWPLAVATTEDKYTLPVALALYSVGQNQSRYGLLLAGSVVVVLPVLLVFLVLQRHFVRGIATTGLK
ncbi:carbohydrate ABC transporter permease [Micromonospora sagamiensis]|uniref:Multiple sugar transport system permease protein n=1 Tax=Micromonospora sagamiensis TaxID=47875 RepID=A0A562WE76_9ACTN|nr:carbohydrate ABC transporter permease [Micromonospora sagamiensis]TWJ28435.1 multiple sugar transport system permease protein [Micromonospora sagamiensis]BCL12674.1 sugar ABC transporter permease [Micromonospora sagamiensis]